MIADGEAIDAQAEAALRAAFTTPGIIDARLMPVQEQQALLAPWLGADLPLDALPIPRLIVLEVTEEGPDVDALTPAARG